MPGAGMPMAPIPSTATGNPHLAVTATVLGGLGLLLGTLVMPLIGIIFGIVAIVVAARSMNSTKKGLAVTGLVLGILTIVLSLIVAYIIGSQKIKQDQGGFILGPLTQLQHADHGNSSDNYIWPALN